MGESGEKVERYDSSSPTSPSIHSPTPGTTGSRRFALLSEYDDENDDKEDSFALPVALAPKSTAGSLDPSDRSDRYNVVVRVKDRNGSDNFDDSAPGLEAVVGPSRAGVGVVDIVGGTAAAAAAAYRYYDDDKDAVDGSFLDGRIDGRNGAADGDDRGVSSNAADDSEGNGRGNGGKEGNGGGDGRRERGDMTPSGGG